MREWPSWLNLDPSLEKWTIISQLQIVKWHIAQCYSQLINRNGRVPYQIITSDSINPALFFFFNKLKRIMAFRMTCWDGFCQADLEFEKMPKGQFMTFRGIEDFLCCSVWVPIACFPVANVGGTGWLAGHCPPTFQVKPVSFLGCHIHSGSLPCMYPDTALGIRAFKMQLLFCRHFPPSVFYHLIRLLKFLLYF